MKNQNTQTPDGITLPRKESFLSESKHSSTPDILDGIIQKKSNPKYSSPLLDGRIFGNGLSGKDPEFLPRCPKRGLPSTPHNRNATQLENFRGKGCSKAHWRGP